MRLMRANETTAGHRRVYFHLVAADGISPALAEAGGQPQISTNGGGWTDVGIGVLVAIGNGRYYAELAQAAIASHGDCIETRYKSANTAECPGDSVQVVRIFDEVHLAKAALANGYDHDVVTGVDRLMDDDGSTILRTLTPAETIAVTGADWTDATKRITQAGAFANYIWRSGDEITLTAGTGVTTGQYEIAAKIDDDTIELVADINGAGGDIADASVEGEIATGRVMRTAS